MAFDRPFVMELSECGINVANYEDLLRLLPERLQVLSKTLHRKLQCISVVLFSYGSASIKFYENKKEAYRPRRIESFRIEGWGGYPLSCRGEDRNTFLSHRERGEIGRVGGWCLRKWTYVQGQ